MIKKKDKWYLPDEFKPEYWKGRGYIQIGIGIAIAICGVFIQQNIIIVGGIAWTIFGVVLVALDSKGEQEDEQQGNKTKRDKNDTDKDDGEYYDSDL